jgi:glycyl-tRNA synthetase beta chain
VAATDTLLVELLTEELPPKALATLGAVFRDAIVAGLLEKKFLGGKAEGQEDILATPRRLAALIHDVSAVQPDQLIERKGPSVAQGLDANGKPTPALSGFAKSCGVPVEALAREKDAKGEYFIARIAKKGEPLDAHLQEIVRSALKKLPTPKLMRWGAGDAQFVRPAHRLVMLHGTRVIPGEVLGLKAGRSTLGHRFLSAGAIEIARAGDYAATLRERGSVTVSFAERKGAIAWGLREAADKHGARLAEHDALLEEVTALVEHPFVYTGTFDPAFLAVPQECLVLSMKQHQKYFPLVDGHGKLMPRFLIAANIEAGNSHNIAHGNERVLRARLSDAKFFYDQDRKTRLEARVPRLANVVYHNKLGSQLARVERITGIATAIAKLIGADMNAVGRAAHLCKADLLTDMVGEFPDLQGTMGRYYALADGEPGEVADAIEAHYRPRFAGDALPQNRIGTILALADKLETLAGLFGIGQLATGDKDPFALRRHALGAIRLLSEQDLPLDLQTLCQIAIDTFPSSQLQDSVEEDNVRIPLRTKLIWFLEERAASNLREKGYTAQEVESLFSLAYVPSILLLPHQYVSRLEAVRKARSLFPEQFSALAVADKRARNILKKSGGESETQNTDEHRLIDDAEKSLLSKTRELRKQVDKLTLAGNFEQALLVTVQICKPVTDFFDSVMVNAEDNNLRINRFRLLHEVTGLTNRVADISKLAT